MEDGVQFHYPGMNYTGPGTHVVSNVLNRKFPKDYDDALTLIHDIEYLMYSDRPDMIKASDERAIQLATTDLHGLSIKAGLTIRKTFDLDFYSSEVPTRVGFLLRDFVTQDAEWNEILKAYNVSFGDYMPRGSFKVGSSF